MMCFVLCSVFIFFVFGIFKFKLLGMNVSSVNNIEIRSRSFSKYVL